MMMMSKYLRCEDDISPCDRISRLERRAQKDIPYDCGACGPVSSSSALKQHWASSDLCPTPWHVKYCENITLALFVLGKVVLLETVQEVATNGSWLDLAHYHSKLHNYHISNDLDPDYTPS